MSAILAFVLIVVAFWCGFILCAIFIGGSRQDEIIDREDKA